MKYIKPEFLKKSFNCPYCGNLAQQEWLDILSLGKIQMVKEYLLGGKPRRKYKPVYISHDIEHVIKFSICQNCKEAAVWYGGELIYPLIPTHSLPEPHKDLPDELREDYEEARRVFIESPRSAAALLRLIVEKLVELSGGKGKNLTERIHHLFKEKRLPKDIARALHIVRLIGNNAVHPGSLDVNDNVNIVLKLFTVVNIIAEYLLEKGNSTIEELYESLPDDKKKLIDKDLET